MSPGSASSLRARGKVREKSGSRKIRTRSIGRSGVYKRAVGVEAKAQHTHTQKRKISGKSNLSNKGLDGREGTAMLGAKIEPEALPLTPPTPEGKARLCSLLGGSGRDPTTGKSRTRTPTLPTPSRPYQKILPTQVSKKQKKRNNPPRRRAGPKKKCPSSVDLI